MPSIGGVKIDKELAKAVVTEDIMEQLKEELESAAVSMKSLLALLGMALPGMIGILVSMFSNLQLALLMYIGSYTVADLVNYQVVFYLGFTLGPIASVLVYLLVAHWAEKSFKGLIVIRVVGRTASGSKTATFDYMGEMPKPMRKPRIEELGSRLGAYLKEQVHMIQRGDTEEEVQARLTELHQRLASAHRRALERLKETEMTTQSRMVTIPKQNEKGEVVYGPDGEVVWEQLEVKVPVFKSKMSRSYRLGLVLVILFVSLFTLWGLNTLLFYGFGFDLIEFLFWWFPLR